MVQLNSGIDCLQYRIPCVVQNNETLLKRKTIHSISPSSTSVSSQFADKSPLYFSLHPPRYRERKRSIVQGINCKPNCESFHRLTTTSHQFQIPLPLPHKINEQSRRTTFEEFRLDGAEHLSFSSWHAMPIKATG